MFRVFPILPLSFVSMFCPVENSLFGTQKCSITRRSGRLLSLHCKLCIIFRSTGNDLLFPHKTNQTFGDFEPTSAQTKNLSKTLRQSPRWEYYCYVEFHFKCQIKCSNKHNKKKKRNKSKITSHPTGKKVIQSLRLSSIFCRHSLIF